MTDHRRLIGIARLILINSYPVVTCQHHLVGLLIGDPRGCLRKGKNGVHFEIAT